MASEAPEPEPGYYCALLRDQHGRFLLERRPLTATHAPGLLTCFGGAREPGESPRACIERELGEELGLRGLPLVRLVRLVSPGREIAWFYGAQITSETRLCTEPGRQALWIDARDLAAAALSDWHRAAIAAALAGQPVANV